MSHSEAKDNWTHLDFEEMSWHDNHIHGFSLVEGEYGAGTICFDIDYILDWIKRDSGGIAFSIAPASLTFYDVTKLELHIDYAKPTAALSPFSLDLIERREEKRDRYTAVVWRLHLNWPEGFICFEASGYEQTLRATPIVTTQQVLTREERGDG